MTLSNDEFAALGLGLGLGVGLGVGTGATLMSPALGLGMGVGIVATVLYATQQKRNGEPEDDDCVESDDVATDGGTVRRETPQTAATEHPTVLDIDVVGDRALASVEKGDVSVVVEAPAGISAEELEQTLSGVPKSIERTTGQFAETPRMSDDTTELDGSIDTEDVTDEGVSPADD